MALLAGCSDGSAIAPTSSTMQGHHFLAMSGRVPSVVNPVGMLRLLQVGAPNHRASFNACPATGPIVYVSDFNANDISIYKVPLAGQKPCGLLTASSGLVNPEGLIVRHSDLFVANTIGHDVLAFHRGATTPYITYTDGIQLPLDVTVSNDNYVFATNEYGGGTQGSISIWQKQSGALVGFIPNPDGALSYYLTIQKDGTLYYDDSSWGLFKGSCAGGSCGAFTNTGATFNYPGGLRSVDDEDVVLVDQKAAGGGAIFTYEPPNFSNPVVCTLGGTDPVTIDINRRQSRAFVADLGRDEVLELSYPGCKLIGFVRGEGGGALDGVAKDYPETLH